MKHRLLLLVVTVLFGSSGFSQNTNLQVGSVTRNMIVHAPANLGANKPLVISMHGMNQDAPYQQGMAHWEYVADTAKFVVVYPNAINKSWDLSGMSDINFILAIIDNMYTKYGIDRSRVYLTGFSMGGMMTYYAMNKIADKIAAFAPVSGYLMGGPNATSSRPVPIIHTHGDADDVVNYNGVSTCMNAWVKRNKCTATAVVTKPYPANKPASNSSRSFWGMGECETEIVLLTLAGKGHWHSNDDAGVYTTTEIWNFVKRYSTDCGKIKPNGTSVALTSPTSNTVFAAPASITLTASASRTGGSITKVEFYSGLTKLGEDATSPYSFEWTSVAAGSYSITAVATDNAGAKTTSAASVIKISPAQAPFGGVPVQIPGTIQFENFDIGGNTFAYLDNDAGNTGGAPFRTDEDVDIEVCTDAGTGYNIGFATAGEWLEYTVNVAKAGKYDISLRVACKGDERTVSLNSDGAVLAKDIAVPNTADWQTWSTVTVPDISLKAGVQVIRLTIGATDYVNLNYMTVKESSLPSVSLPSVSLKTGWNLIGCPLNGTTDVTVALSSVLSNVEAIKNQDYFYIKSQPMFLNTLSKVEWGQGYWVKVNKDCDLEWSK